MSDKVYELKKDANTPAGYWRAGARKTELEWRNEFHISEGTSFKWISEWFIDLTPNEKPEVDEVKEIVESIFERHSLHSITYKEAAVEACKECLTRFKMHSNF